MQSLATIGRVAQAAMALRRSAAGCTAALLQRLQVGSSAPAALANPNSYSPRYRGQRQCSASFAEAHFSHGVRTLSRSNGGGTLLSSCRASEATGDRDTSALALLSFLGGSAVLGASLLPSIAHNDAAGPSMVRFLVLVQLQAAVKDPVLSNAVKESTVRESCPIEHSQAGLEQVPSDPYARPTELKGLPKEILMYQYEVCPYCNKVKAFLDFHKVCTRPCLSVVAC